MFVKQSHLAMAPPIWLHVDGVSLPSNMQPFQTSVRSYDYQTKHLQSPVQSPTSPLVSPNTNASYSVTTIDGPFSFHNNINKQQKILENLDMPKKIFKERQIKKVKSSSGLIKGTALSRNTPQASTFTSPAPSAISINTLQDDQLPIVTFDNADDGHSSTETIEQPNEIRRPRVYFADYNRIQFIQDNDELSQQQQIPINDEPRQSRVRLSKKISTTTNTSNHTTPSIPRSQAHQSFTCPTSRHPCHQMEQGLPTKKQQLLATPRSQQSHTTNLPDILSQSMAPEITSHEKYILQREKPLNRFQKPSITATNDPSNNLAFEISSEHTHRSNARSPPVPDSSNESQKSDSNESDRGQLHAGHTPLSLTSTNRQRPSLRTISLRQQFVLPNKLKSTDVSSMNNPNQHQQMDKLLPNTQRSPSLKLSTSRTHDHHDELHSKGPLLTIDKRSMTGNEPGKQLKRSYVIHYNSKKAQGTTINHSSQETNRHAYKLHSNESTQENFQNLLTIVRPSYTSGTGPSFNRSSILSNGSTMSTADEIRSSRNRSVRGPLEFNHTSNTITV